MSYDSVLVFDDAEYREHRVTRGLTYIKRVHCGEAKDIVLVSCGYLVYEKTTCLDFINEKNKCDSFGDHK